MLVPIAIEILHLYPVRYVLFDPLDCKFRDGNHCFIHHAAQSFIETQ